MADAEQRLLMLIDDEPAQSRLITALAAREGWRTVVVRDSETASATLGTRWSAVKWDNRTCDNSLKSPIATSRLYFCVPSEKNGCIPTVQLSLTPYW